MPVDPLLFSYVVQRLAQDFPDATPADTTLLAAAVQQTADEEIDSFITQAAIERESGEVRS